jgi:hypothetical protein
MNPKLALLLTSILAVGVVSLNASWVRRVMRPDLSKLSIRIGPDGIRAPEELRPVLDRFVDWRHQSDPNVRVTINKESDGSLTLPPSQVAAFREFARQSGQLTEAKKGGLP